MKRLKGKTIVITAGYGDIGRATCRRFCEEGVRVFMTGRKPLQEGALIAAVTQRQAHRIQAKRLRALGVPSPKPSGSIEYLACDSSSRASIDTMLAEIHRRAGRIDVAIGNAALVYNEPFLKLDPEHWQATLDLNLTGQFHFGQAAARIMVRQKPAKIPGSKRGIRGKIIFNGSWVGEMPWAEGCSYAVAKA
ncbi:MAG: SDR family NAD(P)-dependent oxidoreductase, partial [Kiritimatiellota bacterium]|nr:SDR family NAD(P)-dependent oxidoreductase [Kiritimatiellota bacterium]